MVFSSIMFLFVYLPLVLGIYYVTPLKWRNLMLLIANLVFYAWGEPVYILIMFASILIDYTHGMLIEKYRTNDRLARGFVVSSVVFNLGLLLFFKYFDFFIVNLNAIPAFAALGLQPLGLALPIGISFYTFQTMSYTIDVYRGEARAQRNLVSFGTYVTLFPQLIAGPIVKYKDVAEQLTGRTHSIEQFASGVQLFVVGLGKKVLLANNIGLLWDYYKALPVDSLTVCGAWLGILAFAFQIYFDFSGYSDMARGLGRMFGFEFKLNFNYPYISKSITEFWRRWHISLGSWFRDYVYIPLGGNRVALPLHYRNILVVWLLTGFWHGAAWNFLLWGLYFAVWLMLEKAFLGRWLEKIGGWAGHLYAIVVIMFGWAIFAVEDIGQLTGYLQVMLGCGGVPFSDGVVGYQLRSYASMLLVLLLGSTPLPARWAGKLVQASRGVLIPLFVLLIMLLCTAYLVDASYNPFLYFRF